MCKKPLDPAGYSYSLVQGLKIGINRQPLLSWTDAPHLPAVGSAPFPVVHYVPLRGGSSANVL